jgi:hypothetical protein
MPWYWLILPAELIGIPIAYRLGGMEDRRLIRRLNVQPWWPPMGTKPPTNAYRHRHVG